MNRPRPPLVALAEPEPALRRMLADILEECGCDVLEVRDGIELLEYLGEACEGDEDWPQLLVAADDMPGLGALDVLLELRDAGSARPATIVLSRRPCAGLRAAAEHLGVAVVLDDPPDRATMETWVQRLLSAAPVRVAIEGW